MKTSDFWHNGTTRLPILNKTCIYIMEPLVLVVDTSPRTCPLYKTQMWSPKLIISIHFNLCNQNHGVPMQNTLCPAVLSSTCTTRLGLVIPHTRPPEEGTGPLSSTINIDWTPIWLADTKDATSTTQSLNTPVRNWFFRLNFHLLQLSVGGLLRGQMSGWGMGQLSSFRSNNI
jgi:hypothetical protein